MSIPVRSLLVITVALLALAITPGVARATPNFPPAIQSALGAVSAPDCSVCHVGRTGRGTVNSAFGSAMRSRGLVAYDEASLRRALQAMEAEKIDSDGDAILDVDALRAGKSPNPAGADGIDIEPEAPAYGCVGRVAPIRSPRGVPLALAALFASFIVTRRSRPSWARVRLRFGAPIAVLGAAALSASCAPAWSGNALAPRDIAGTTPSAPAMVEVKSSAFEAELRAAGLDPHALPRFEQLDARQMRRVMSTFSRSLGYACVDCHDRGDPSARTPTRAKTLAVRMWNDMMRSYSVEGGGAVYCDSCHQGQGKFLKRDDTKAVANWMAENLTGKLKTSHDGKVEDLECETCHGPSFDPRFLTGWANAR